MRERRYICGKSRRLLQSPGSPVPGVLASGVLGDAFGCAVSERRLELRFEIGGGTGRVAERESDFGFIAARGNGSSDLFEQRSGLARLRKKRREHFRATCVPRREERVRPSSGCRDVRGRTVAICAVARGSRDSPRLSANCNSTRGFFSRAAAAKAASSAACIAGKPPLGKLQRVDADRRVAVGEERNRVRRSEHAESVERVQGGNDGRRARLRGRRAIRATPARRSFRRVP